MILNGGGSKPAITERCEMIRQVGQGRSLGLGLLPLAGLPLPAGSHRARPAPCALPACVQPIH